MKIVDLAKEYQTTSEFILQTLKSLKLKAKDKDQELNVVVLSVLRSELSKKKDMPKPVKEESSPVSPSTEDPGEKEKPKKKVVKAKKTPKEDKVDKKTPGKSTKKKTSDTKESADDKGDKKTKKKDAEDGKDGNKEPVKKEKLKEPKKEISEESKPKSTKEVSEKKTKSRIGTQPIITLKPLPKKRKRQIPSSAKGATGGLKKEFDAQPSVGSPDVDGREPDALSSDQLTDLEVKVPITVKDLSTRIQKKPSFVLKELMKMGIMTHINQSLDAELVEKIARIFGYNYIKTKTQEEQVLDHHKQLEEDPKLLKQRAPVITFMGHVDHGKTTLLDKIRQSKIADQEHGGITQHIGAYSVKINKGTITFLDTPGHEAFTAMRARGAHITDLVIVVIAADEGIMPQTEEAINHARAADVPIVVALTKIDRRNADPDRVKKQLSEIGLGPEDWGGKTVVVPVSGITGEGVDTLLEMILLESELLELRANPDKKASGIIVEAHLSQGRGAVTTLIVQNGTLQEGDIIIAGSYYGKIKAMFDDRERPIKEAGPSIPAEILGLSQVPEAGERFFVVNDEKQAKEITSQRQESNKDKKLNISQQVNLEHLYAQIQAGTIKELNVIIKSDVQGSLEALKDSLAKIPSDKVKLKFIHLGVGDVNSSDVLLAVASKAIIIAFHVGVDTKAKQELEKEPVDVRQYRIIYDAVDDIRSALEGLLEAKKKKIPIAKIEIKEVFKLSKQGIVAGCYVVKGKVKRKDLVDVYRNGEIVHTSSISSLKRFKDDVKEVTEGMECGITVTGFDKIQAGDILETHEIETIAQKL